MTAQSLGECYVMHGEVAEGFPEDKLEDILLA
jgi:hypothetical protein